MTKSEFLRVQCVLQTTCSCVSDCRPGLMANLVTALLSAQLSCQSTRSLLVNNLCCCKLWDLQNTDDMLIDIYCWWVQIQVHHTRRRSALRAIKRALALKANSWTAISTYSESLFPLSKLLLLSSSHSPLFQQPNPCASSCPDSVALQMRAITSPLSPSHKKPSGKWCLGAFSHDNLQESASCRAT